MPNDDVPLPAPQEQTTNSPRSTKSRPDTWAPTPSPKSTLVPGQMRSDREEVPGGYTKQDADKAEIAEANELQERSAKRGTSALAAPTDCMTYWPEWRYQVCGAIRVKYDSLGGPNSFLLWPTSSEIRNPDNVGVRQTFTNGPIYWHPNAGAHPVANHFFAAWQRNGWEGGKLGYPTSDEMVNSDNIGRRQTFQGGTIYWKLNEAWYVTGAIRDKWNQLGPLPAERSFLGYPISDEIRLPDGIGYMNRFENGVIYWSPSSGAWPVSGPILDMWAAEGYEGGPHRYPIADQTSPIPNRFEQKFQVNKLNWPTLVDVANVITYKVQSSELLSEGPVPPNLIDMYDGTDPPVLQRRAPSDGQPSDCVRGFKNLERSVSCSDLAWTIVRYETRNGVERETGRVPFVAKNWAEFDKSSSFGASPEWELGSRIEVGEAQGTMATNPTDFIFSSMCESSTLCDSTEQPSAETHELRSNAIIEETWRQKAVGPVTGGAGMVDQMRGALGARLLHGPVSPWSADNNHLEGRCDSVVVQVGCVNDKAFAGIAFNAQKTPKVLEVAQHVFDAQASLPSRWGVYGVPLTRAMDTAVIDANRAVACPTGSATPPLECDEYPMASTHQGAAFVSPGDWSSRPVPKEANDSQGGTMSSTYNAARLIENDPYVVLAILPDGRTSW
ncbi:hypothetical protein ACHIPZ_18360 [Antrihabitans sp. NCIMB 15449]|uniref:Deoxyribonuclease NucA/NucB domain-containing protein n=1 Tax=Antrihabitans spumae TaxID=3373370 RepID=A0ABW7JQ51_9NOCA